MRIGLTRSSFTQLAYPKMLGKHTIFASRSMGYGSMVFPTICEAPLRARRRADFGGAPPRRWLSREMHPSPPRSNNQWLFREKLTTAGAIKRLFEQFDAMLRQAGYILHRHVGQRNQPKHRRPRFSFKMHIASRPSSSRLALII